jgi:hypothetical protein
MMGEQPAREPADLIIFGTTALLAIVVGIGIAFALWSEMHWTAARAVLTAAVGALAAGTGCLGFAFEKPVVRLFLLVFASTLLLAFFFGGPIFRTLIP